MPLLGPQLRAAISDRIRYYNDLGIYDFYQQPVQAIAAPEVAGEGARATLPLMNSMKIAVSSDPVTALRQIREDIGDCTRCRLAKQGRKQIVFGVGNPRADLMFIGEAPGADEDEKGEPFVGRAGQLLTNMIKAMGLSREEVYIANIIKCRPPGNRTPERDECETCSPLMRQCRNCAVAGTISAVPSWR
jgi:uracil-DNA glycosylase